MQVQLHLHALCGKLLYTYKETAKCGIFDFLLMFLTKKLIKKNNTKNYVIIIYNDFC